MSKDEVWYNDIAGSLQFTRTATNAETTYEVGRVVSDTIKSTVRSTGIGDWYITFDGSEANSIKGIAILGMNTGTWVTLEAQGDDADFAGAPAATSNFTVRTRALYQYNAASRKVEPATRYDAYIKEDWGYQDYRIKFNSTAVSYYDIGRIYIFTESETCESSSAPNVPAGITTVSSIIDGEGGQRVKVPKFQQFSYNMQFRGINRTQVDYLEKVLPLNPSLVWAVDGIDGQLVFGSIESTVPQAAGKVFDNKVSMTCILTESL